MNKKINNSNRSKNKTNNNKKVVKNNNSLFSFIFISLLLLIPCIIIFDTQISIILLNESPILYKEYYSPVRTLALDNYKLIKNNLFSIITTTSTTSTTSTTTMNENEFKNIKTFDYSNKDLNESKQISINNLDNGEWSNFQWGSYVGDQGIITKQKGYLRVDSNPYTGCFEHSFADHIKFLAVNSNPFTIPTNGSLKVTFRARSQSKGLENHPFGNLVSDPNSDYRLASGILNVLDFKTSIVADFALTNKMIYALYERLPVSKELYGDYATFIYIVPVHKVNNNESFNDLSIVYSKETNTIEWLVNGKQVLIHDKVGHFLSEKYNENRILYKGGVEQSVFPDSINICFGSITLLDSTFINSGVENRTGLVHLDDPNTSKYYNPLDITQELSFFDNDSKRSSLLFNQGNIIDIQHITIETKQ